MLPALRAGIPCLVIDVKGDLPNLLLRFPQLTGEAIAEQHREWNRRFAPTPPPDRHPHDPSPHRRLRIGYVSADLRDHVVGRALLPAFRQHSHEAFEIHCYATSPAQTMSYTGKLAAWRVVTGS